MNELPNNVRSELEDAGIYVDAEDKTLSVDRFNRLSEPAKTTLMRAGFTLYDQVTKREFDSAGSLDRAEFLRRGGRIAN